MTPFFILGAKTISFSLTFSHGGSVSQLLSAGPAILLPHNSISRHLRNFITRRKKFRGLDFSYLIKIPGKQFYFEIVLSAAQPPRNL